jgi:predicted small lipoprotein YifL
MKKVILSVVFAAMVLSISGCQDKDEGGYKERKQTETMPDINRPGNTKRYEHFGG